MSAQLVWHPIMPQASQPLSTGLKWILEKRYLVGQSERELNSTDIAYLEGVRDTAGAEHVNEVDAMLEAIQQYGAIRIWLRY